MVNKLFTLLFASVLVFGLSTAVMFGAMSRLITNHLRHQLHHRGEAAVTQEPV